jgi:hypothetical protein
MDGAVRIAVPDRYECIDERSARKRLTMDVTQGGRADTPMKAAPRTDCASESNAGVDLALVLATRGWRCCGCCQLASSLRQLALSVTTRIGTRTDCAFQIKGRCLSGAHACHARFETA